MYYSRKKYCYFSCLFKLIYYSNIYELILQGQSDDFVFSFLAWQYPSLWLSKGWKNKWSDYVYILHWSTQCQRTRSILSLMVLLSLPPYIMRHWKKRKKGGKEEGELKLNELDDLLHLSDSSNFTHYGLHRISRRFARLFLYIYKMAAWLRWHFTLYHWQARFEVLIGPIAKKQIWSETWQNLPF